MVDQRARGPRGHQAGQRGTRQLGARRYGRHGRRRHAPVLRLEGRHRLPARPRDEQRRSARQEGHGAEVPEQRDVYYYTDPVKSALPWDKKGNFTLAAHRDGHGAKFHNIHQIEVGDPVVFETKDTWYVYKVYKELPKTSKYNVNVLLPVPKESGKKKPGRYLTLTTCTPIYTSDYRYIVWAELVRTEKVDKNRTLPPELR